MLDTGLIDQHRSDLIRLASCDEHQVNVLDLFAASEEVLLLDPDTTTLRGLEHELAFLGAPIIILTMASQVEDLRAFVYDFSQVLLRSKYLLKLDLHTGVLDGLLDALQLRLEVENGQALTLVEHRRCMHECDVDRPLVLLVLPPYGLLKIFDLCDIITLSLLTSVLKSLMVLF